MFFVVAEIGNVRLKRCAFAKILRLNLAKIDTPARCYDPTLDGMKFANKSQEDRVADSTFVLRELQSRSTAPFFEVMDFTHIGAFGHSFGGTVAARLCQRESPVRACINEDREMSGKTLTPGEPAPPLDPTIPVKNPLLVFTLVEISGTGNEAKPLLHAVAQGKTG
jgi:hypothetical protein